jgi:hypothetical protein
MTTVRPEGRVKMFKNSPTISGAAWRAGRFVAISAALLCGALSANAAVAGSSGIVANASAVLTPSPAQPRSAAAFLDSFGVNTHFGSPSYRDPAAVAQKLLLIGVKHVRDSLTIGSTLPALQRLAALAGAKFDLVYGYYTNDGGPDVINKAFSNVVSSAPIIEAFEGPNEPDWFGAWYNGVHYDPANVAAGSGSAVIEAQKLLYRLVKDHPATKNIPVFCPAFSYPAGGVGSPRSAVGNLAAYCDYAPLHAYPENLSLGSYLTYQYIKTWAQFPPTVTAVGRPVVITEGGWPTAKNSKTGVDEATQAKYVLEYLLDAFSQGISRTYLYELLDDVNAPSDAIDENNYGLFHGNGTPKIAATMLANVKTLLQSDRATPKSLAYSVDGMPPNGHMLMLNKGNDTTVLVLWNEANLWNQTTHVAIPLAAATVTLHLETPATVQIYDPLAGTSPLGTYPKAVNLPVDIPDHPIFVFVGR